MAPRIHRSTRTILTAGAAAAIVAAQSTVAVATTHEDQVSLDSAESVAALVTDLGPDTTLQVPVVQNSDETFTTILVNGSEVTLPASGAGQIDLGDTGVSLTLPGPGTADADVASDGTVVYGAGSDDLVTAVQNEGDGVQVQTVSHDPSDTEFVYDLHGATPVLRGDGGLDLGRVS